MGEIFRWIIVIMFSIVATIFFFQGDIVLGIAAIVQGMFFHYLDCKCAGFKS